MSEIITWSVINDEISFIKNLLDFHLTWVDAMYFLDTGSKDGTLEILKDYANKDPRVIVEEYHTKYNSQYEVDWMDMKNPFPEIDIRNYAISRAEKLLNPKWMIQLDGDEIYLPNTKEVILKHPKSLCIGHSTINPIVNLNILPKEIRGGYTLYDPHVRVWRARQGFHYIENPAFKGHHYHCIPTWKGSKFHLFHHPLTSFVKDVFDFHLHWMYGNKIEFFFKKKGITDKHIMIDGQGTNEYSELLPLLFWERRQQWLSE